MSPGHPLLSRYHYPKKEIEKLIKKFQDGEFSSDNNLITETIKPPNEDAFYSLPEKGTSEYKHYSKIGLEAIRQGKLGVVMLNGGMATRFGGVVKGTVEVFDGISFLELKIKDALKISDKINFYIMNSFSTANKTKEYINGKNCFGIKEKIYMFDQCIAPRLTESGEFYLDADDERAFYGPGHGDFLFAFNDSGCLDKFIVSGGKYVFLSNVDNLGARVEPAILGFHIDHRKELIAEVAMKSSGDVGGAPAIVGGRLQLVEGFGFPDDFDQSQIPVFNCSTYWITAEKIKTKFELPWYLVKKTVDGDKVIQFERIAGDLTLFLDTLFLKIERSERFFPIKRPEDLESNRGTLKKLLGY